MKVAILGESAADEAALRILLDSMLGRTTQPAASFPLRTRGWPAVLQVLPAMLKHLHYHTAAEGLILVVDSNHSPVHQPAHELPGETDPFCRHCQLHALVATVHHQLRPRVDQPSIKTAIGVAVPAIEAWYRCGLDPGVTEAAWIQGLQSRTYPYTKNGLKLDVYGTDRPLLIQEIRYATDAARRLAQDLSLLEQRFPNGFGSLACEIRRWMAAQR